MEGEDAHFNQLEEDSTQLSSSEDSGSLFEVEDFLDVDISGFFSVPEKLKRNCVVIFSVIVVKQGVADPSV